ncbi:MAG: glycosyltransferase [Comamonadaceae bacterium]|uniref:glycosyltransferase n=1 Tax=Candidatus Skiveiella danica TaxID=3386177 RepID=UPI00390B4B7E|nr:glycosyltransferase [Comamonadaceae bacterium]
MEILFVHQNFPGQFKHLGPALAKRGHSVTALTMRPDQPAAWQGVRLVGYSAARGSSPGIHPWVVDIETKVIRGEAAFRAAMRLKAGGYRPDCIVAHPGWGESLFLKEVWPDARLGIYCEYFYRSTGADADFDPEFANPDPAGACRLALKNLYLLPQILQAAAGLSPTRWQADGFPDSFRPRIAVVHDGIETQIVKPNANARLVLANGLSLGPGDEVITFVNRNLEPYRGYHVFMRALPGVLRRRPGAQVLIVGSDGQSYGAAAPPGTTWKGIFAGEARAQMSSSEWARVHFLGQVPYRHYLGLLQRSSVHVYLTYPFVLGWSLLEAMSAGCSIVASATAPVQEVMTHGETGRLVPFFDTEGLTEQVCDLLDHPEERQRLGLNARSAAITGYDLQTVCLPHQMRWIEDLAAVPRVSQQTAGSAAFSGG